eukprot:1749132-Rhodomonas_salina.1
MRREDQERVRGGGWEGGLDLWRAARARRSAAASASSTASDTNASATHAAILLPPLPLRLTARHARGRHAPRARQEKRDRG